MAVMQMADAEGVEKMKELYAAFEMQDTDKLVSKILTDFQIGNIHLSSIPA